MLLADDMALLLYIDKKLADVNTVIKARSTRG